nr:unnamed protein product [Trichobilharzia regenti]
MTSESDSSVDDYKYAFEQYYHTASSGGFAMHTFSSPTLINIRRYSHNKDEFRYRIYFISYPLTISHPGSKPTLFCADVSQQPLKNDELTWHSLLPTEFVHGKNPLALADFLLHERMRVSVAGVTNFCLSECGKLIVCASSQIYSAYDKISSEPDELLEPVVEAPLTSAIQPVICPLNSDIVVCLSNENIFIGHTPTNKWTRVTHYSSDSGLSAGTPAFVIQEEFDRYMGYWWRPTMNNGYYQLLYEEVDESNVSVTKLFHSEYGGGWENQHYPTAGTENARSDLKLCQFQLDSTGKMCNIQILSLPMPLKQYIPQFEYLVRVGWTPDGNYVWCQLITRLQQRLSLILIPVDNFCSISNVIVNDHGAVASAAPAASPATSINTSSFLSSISPCIELITEEEPKYWVKVHDFLTFLTNSWHPVTGNCSNNNNNEVTFKGGENCTFIWASHRSGYTHLYLVQCSWSKDKLSTIHHNNASTSANVDNNNNNSEQSAVLIKAEHVYISQLTNGSWEVTGNKIWLDENNQLVYFEANKEHPILRNIYCVSYANEDRGCLSCLTAQLSLTTNNSTEVETVEDEHISSLSSSLPSSMPVNINQSNILDPYFSDAKSHLKPYPLSYEVSAFNPNYGIMIIESSSLDKLIGIQVCRITMMRMMNNSDHENRQHKPILQHIGWLRKHVSHYNAYNGFQPTNPPMILRCDIFNNLDMNNNKLSVVSSNYVEFNDPQSILYGQLFIPNYNHSRLMNGYPTVHFVYGGPGIQLVRGSYSRSVFAHAQLFCHYGYAVFLCDCRGSANRGIHFDGYIKNRMGQVELDDHVAFLKYAAKATGLIDLSRVAIMGYSFGGYMSLMAAVRYHHVYRAAIAVSPVVDWALYDSAYTERYIGLPEDNPDAYKKGNVMQYVSNMPSNDEYRLYIFHGGQDENVHFVHTSSLIEKLKAAGKPHHFQFYPNSRHRLNHQSHLEAIVLIFLEDKLSNTPTSTTTTTTSIPSYKLK